MKESLVSSIQGFLEKEKITMRISKASDSEFWLESQDNFLVVKFYVDHADHTVFYDVFSPKYDIHLREETLRDVERLDLIAEETGRWEYEKTIEDFWLVLDHIKLFAQKNGLHVKEKRLI